jgi:monoterpene epsilon-lactone hydrolase
VTGFACVTRLVDVPYSPPLSITIREPPLSLRSLLLASAIILISAISYAQEKASVPQTNSSFIDANGTAHVTRVVPVPKTVSPDSQKWLSEPMLDTEPPVTDEQNKARAEAWQKQLAIDMQGMYPTKVTEDKIAGVPVRIITPPSIPASKHDRVLINIHGGGFRADWGSVAETIPIASLTQTKVVAIRYRLAPEYPFPAAVDDTVAVYKDLLKTYKPQNMVMYGTSAGAVLTAEVAVKLKQLGLPLPAALGIFSGFGDFTHPGDSRALFGLRGLQGPLNDPPDTLPDPVYVGSTDRRDPVLSPVFADLKGMPPTLFITSERDLLLSGTSILHRAFLNADNNNAALMVFEALPHAYWNQFKLPESIEAHHLMAKFFDKALSN